MSSLGLERSNQKVISQEPNLLTEWLNERASSSAEVRRLTLGYVATSLGLVLVLILIPAWLFGTYQRTSEATKQLSALSAQSDEEKRKDEELAALKVREVLIVESRAAVSLALNRLFGVLNSKSNDLVISKIRFEVVQDKLEVAGEAEAANLAAANQFIQTIEIKSPESQGVLSSARESGIIGPSGISFQFLSTGKVKP